MLHWTNYCLFEWHYFHLYIQCTSASHFIMLKERETETFKLHTPLHTEYSIHLFK